MAIFKVTFLPKFCTYFCGHIIHLSDDDYPKNTKKWEYKSQSSSFCYSLRFLFTLTVLAPNIFTNILFTSACKVVTLLLCLKHK
jgi:hypothetical protein